MVALSRLTSVRLQPSPLLALTAALTTWAFCAHAQPTASAAPETSGLAAGGQQALDFMAGFAMPQTAASPGAAYRPSGRFSAWSKADQEAVPPAIKRVCTFMWVMAHDAPGARFLPPQAPEADERLLGALACIAGHMPSDWPGRASYITPLSAILNRAQALGSPLQLPAALAR